jgi:hypothetical protein
MVHVRRFATAAIAVGMVLAATTPALGVGLGKTQIANGQTDGERQAVTPLKLTKDVAGYTVSAGKKIVCLRLKIRNAGPKALEEFPGTGAKLRLKGGVTQEAAITGGGVCKSGGLIKLKPGKSITFNLPFEIRKSDKIIGFEYTASSGFGTNTPVWAFS